MKSEIQDLAKRLEQGEIDKAGFAAGVSSLIEDSAAAPKAGQGPAAEPGETRAERSHEISFAARRARSL